MKKIILLVIVLIVFSYSITSQNTETCFIIKLDLNGINQTSSISYFDDDLVFFSSIGLNNLRRSKKNNLNFYFGFIDEYGEIIKSKKASNSINSKNEELNLSFTKNNKVVYFTRKSDDGDLEIYKADVIKLNKWENITKLPFNKKGTSFTSPSISSDGKMLYFSSNMKRTLGQFDIYKTEVLVNGKFGALENLGEKVNTAGIEKTPFVVNNTLYYASNGKGGLGGFDIFSIDLDLKSSAVNMGAPINSKKDEFGYVSKKHIRIGYFNSNRDGKNKIYSFQYFTNRKIVNEIVKNDSISKKKPTVLPLLIKKEVVLEKEVLKPKISKSQTVKKIITPIKKRSLNLEYVRCQNEFDKIKNVFFDLNKWDLTKASKTELNKVIAVMKKCPNIKLTASSHTDSRATNKYNLKLSQLRANSIVNYIIEKGNIHKNRITSLGYGEGRLRNKCSNKVKCSEAKHRLNRRTEFEISNF